MYLHHVGASSFRPLRQCSQVYYCRAMLLALYVCGFVCSLLRVCVSVCVPGRDRDLKHLLTVN